MNSSKLERVARERQKVRFVPLDIGRPVGSDDHHFDLAYHVGHTALPAAAPARGLATTEATMTRPRMRPSFALDVACSAEQLMGAFRRHLVSDSEDVEGEFSALHGTLRIPEEKRRFWTPCLELTVERIAGKEDSLGAAYAKLWGTFSPLPEIWTGFVFAIGTLVIMSIFSTVYGIAQVALGYAPFALLVPIVSIFLAALLYFSALVGQGLSISEMYRLRAFVDDCRREAEELASRRPQTARESSQL